MAKKEGQRRCGRPCPFRFKILNGYGFRNRFPAAIAPAVPHAPPDLVNVISYTVILPLLR
jgi:hypothetical protein